MQIVTKTATVFSSTIVDLSIPAGSTVIASGVQPNGNIQGGAYASCDGPHPTDNTKWRFQISVQAPFGGNGYTVGVTCWLGLGYPGEIVVSPTGLAGGAAFANAGADYGPDTPNTTSCGLQEAINYAVNQGLAGKQSPTIRLLAGVFPVTAFTNSSLRAGLVIDAGYDIYTGPPISIRILGAQTVANSINGMTFNQGYPLGASVIDGSSLDTLAQGLFSQGRVILVPPQAGANWPTNAVHLAIENVTVVCPTYSTNGTGSPSYTLGGYGAMSLFVNGNTEAGNTSHFLFANGIDAWGASDVKVRNVQVLSAIAAFNGYQHAGGGGVQPFGPCCGLVLPEGGNQGIISGQAFSTYDIPIGVMTASHTSFDQLNVQSGSVAIYTRQAGHGGYFSKIKVQQTNYIVQHLLMTQLTNSLAGHTVWDPVGDLYTPYSKTFPTSASPGSLVISHAGLESVFTAMLLDDPSNPLALTANVEFAGSISASKWGSGTNCVVNFIDAAANSQQSLAGTTAGSVKWVITGSTPYDKRFVAYLNGYENTTGTAQTITFLNPFTVTPAIIKDITAGAGTVSATTYTLPASMGSPLTGYLILEGY